MQTDRISLKTVQIFPKTERIYLKPLQLLIFITYYKTFVMRSLLLSISLFIISAKPFCQAHSNNGHQETLNADSVLNWLKNGNDEFVHGQFNVHGIDSSLRM